MKNSDLIFQQGHAQAAQHALENYQGERGESEIAQPAAIFDPPQPDSQDDREKSDR